MDVSFETPRLLMRQPIMADAERIAREIAFLSWSAAQADAAAAVVDPLAPSLPPPPMPYQEETADAP